ncbi:hypothetical protein [Pseudomonas sp. NA-150]|uniref:hypothetical protein n=1 Tax=Pseudomonas sp. NA-150 TaxID=3367525 RepID=UPI0037CB9C5A
MRIDKFNVGRRIITVDDDCRKKTAPPARANGTTAAGHDPTRKGSRRATCFDGLQYRGDMLFNGGPE